MLRTEYFHTLIPITRISYTLTSTLTSSPPKETHPVPTPVFKRASPVFECARVSPTGQFGVKLDYVARSIYFMRNGIGRQFTCAAPPNRCVLISCYWYASLIICSTRDTPVRMNCGTVADIGFEILVNMRVDQLLGWIGNQKFGSKLTPCKLTKNFYLAPDYYKGRAYFPDGWEVRLQAWGNAKCPLNTLPYPGGGLPFSDD
ncbi:hypothetical protein ABW19_dt0202732 [Dactylella cylindrospora]|nr:hypothetical protein ABW19_dt0202732 [Dactylella cylindrospora]